MQHAAGESGESAEVVVKREDFSKLTRVSVPEACSPPQRVWSDAEWALIRRGHRSAEMEDKWNAFVENDRLFLHRSWTGHGIYEAQFVRGQQGWFITELLVCGDRDIYRYPLGDNEAATVESLIDSRLLRR